MAIIDRDPNEMIRYGLGVKEIVGEINTLMGKVERILDAYAPDLDDPTQKDIEQLHICCQDARKAFEAYYNTADAVEKKGIALKNVREGR